MSNVRQDERGPGICSLLKVTSYNNNKEDAVSNNQRSAKAQAFQKEPLSPMLANRNRNQRA